MRHLLLLCPLVSTPLAASLAGQVWTQIHANGGPTSALAAAATFDVGANRTVMFVGAPAPATWLFDNITWTTVNPASTPSARRGFAMVYDVIRLRAVLFGGVDAAGQALSDTWEWNGSNWLARNVTTPPPARFGHSMAHDPFRRRTVLFGGNDGASVPGGLTDTWEWDGTNWIQVPTAHAPDGCEAGAMCFDTARMVHVLFGGRRRSGGPDGNTWEYDGTDWVDRTAIVGLGPAVFGHGMVFDAVNRAAVLYGGTNGANVASQNTWEYDGLRWRQAAAGVPSRRSGFVMTMDTSRQRTVLHGGLDSTLSVWLRDTWSYRSGVRIPGSYTVVAGGCLGSRGVPTNTVVTTPRIGETMWICLANLPPPLICLFLIGYSNTSSPFGPLPLSLAPVGAPGCFLRNSVETTVLVRGTDGFALFAVPVPNLAYMAGIQFYAQGLVLDPGVNSLGAVMSQAAMGVIGH